MEPRENHGGFTRRWLLRQAGLLGVVLAGGGSEGAGRSLAALTAARAAAVALPLTPEQEEGPYYVAIEKIRENITLGRPGVPLRLKLKVVDASTGKPIKGAACDIWQCDATGIYSDEAQQSTSGRTWLRGVQFTDAHGVAEFLTIYPGHYVGRATHVHVKVHVGGEATGATYSGGHVAHTGQLFFDDAVSGQVYALAPYSSSDTSRVLDGADRVYTGQGGARSMLKLSHLGKTPADGFLGTITLAVVPASTPMAVGATSGAAAGGAVTEPPQSPPRITPGPGPGM